MRAITLNTTDATAAATSSGVAVLDTYKTPFNVGFGLNVTGTVSCTVQHTFDDPLAAGFVAASAKWYDHPDVAAATADADGNYAFPVRAIRLSQASGSGSAVLTVVQAG
jgi:hypothetical protein